jgi:hypothetical protein
MYVTHRLSQVDDHTLQCQAGGTTWVPVPQSAEGNFAALLTIDLPSGVRKGQSYTVVVRQVTSATLTERIPVVEDQQPADQVGATAAVSERRVLGAFQLTIPVTIGETLLEPEERLLAIMRWIGEGIPPGDRWSPVFERYLAQIAARVDGFGGNPAQILPSPTGAISHTDEHAARRHAVEFTGKVTGLAYDRFGDFEGFLVLTEEGRELRFQSTEREVEALMRRAWAERIVITVFADRQHSHTPASIVLRRPPWRP